MRSKKFLLTCFILTMVILSSQVSHPSLSSTTDSYSGLRTNRVINADTLTFSTNDTFQVFMSIENIKSEVVYDLNFNYTVNKDIFTILDSTNTSQTSNDWVYYNFNKIQPGQLVTFNMSLQVVSNKTESITLNAVTLKYVYGVDNRVAGSSTTNTLKLTIRAPNTSVSSQTKVLGDITIDQTMLIIIVAMPIIFGFGLSFIFGRRRNKF